MNTKASNNNIWIWVVVAVVIAAIAYFYVYGSSNQSTGLSATNDNNAAVGAQVLGLLGQIQKLRVDTTFFNDPGYKTLRDYSVTIPPVNVGRPNPFAPLSGISTQISTTSQLMSSAPVLKNTTSTLKKITTPTIPTHPPEPTPPSPPSPPSGPGLNNFPQ